MKKCTLYPRFVSAQAYSKHVFKTTLIGFAPLFINNFELVLRYRLSPKNNYITLSSFMGKLFSAINLVAI